MSARPVPALPSASPRILLRRAKHASAFPFEDPHTSYFYLGRGAVWHAVRLLELENKEVLVPAYHHGVEVEALCAAGAKPIFYNVKRDFTVDLDSLREVVTPQTASVYVTYFAGFPQPLDDIIAFARERNLRVIEDCALALFSRDGAQPLGARGDASIFCFHKTLPVPNGGALWLPGKRFESRLPAPHTLIDLHQLMSATVARIEREFKSGAKLRDVGRRVAETLRRVRPLPIDAHPVGHRTFRPGQETLGISANALRIARSLDPADVVHKRRSNYLSLAMRLRDTLPPLYTTLPDGTCPLFYPAWCENKAALHAALVAQNIHSIDFWNAGSPLIRPGEFPDVDALRRHVIELPIHQDLDESDLARIAFAVRRALGTA